MEVFFWGTRGALPPLTRKNAYYGCNTTCVELCAGQEPCLIFDAGTGLVPLGQSLPPDCEAHIFISGSQLECWHALPHFAPLYQSGARVCVYLPPALEQLPSLLFASPFFRLDPALIKAELQFKVLSAESPHLPAGLTLEASQVDLTGKALNYRVSDGTSTFLYAGPGNSKASLGKALIGVQCAVLPLENELADKLAASCKKLDPEQEKLLFLAGLAAALTDRELNALRGQLEGKAALHKVHLACQDLRVNVEQGRLYPPVGGELWFDELRDSLALYKDDSVILDHILLKSRELANADAGTVYILDGNELVFAYTHNDTLFPVSMSSKHAYADVRIAVNTSSISGYVATTQKSLNIADVYKLPKSTPYSFNSSFDKKTGYRTVSALTVPLLSRTGILLGVMQLLNSLDRQGRPVPFGSATEELVLRLAVEAAATLENNQNVLRGIKRLLRIVTMHDPAESISHAERVGALAAELYQHWAQKQGQQAGAVRYYKSQLRLAAMLHDIGKVGVSEGILKKEGRFNPQERRLMAEHSLFGAGLFAGETGDISVLVAETSLHHHQKWNGSWQSELAEVPVLSGEKIPLAARLTALADVFDSLVHPRGYQDSWSFDDALRLIEREAGGHFDPELVASFLEILDVVKAIYLRYPSS